MPNGPTFLSSELLGQVAPEARLGEAGFSDLGETTPFGLTPQVGAGPQQMPFPQMPQAPEEGGFWSRLLGQAPMIMAAMIRDPQRRQQAMQRLQQMTERSAEQQRKKKAAAEVQYITSTLEQHLISNDLEGFSKTIQQLGKKTDWEPETIAATTQIRYKMADMFGSRRREEDVAAKLGRVLSDPNLTDEQFMGSLAQIPGLQPNVIDDLTRARASSRQQREKVATTQRMQAAVDESEDIPAGVKPFVRELALVNPAGVAQFIKEQKPPSVGTEAELLAQAGGFPSFAAAPQEVKVKIERTLQDRKDRSEQRQLDRLAMEAKRLEASQRKDVRLADVEQKEVLGLRRIVVASQEWGKNYEAMLKSYGGKMPFGLRLIVDALSNPQAGLVTRALAAGVQASTKLTPEAETFISHITRMQAFARAQLNDVGNLSNFERTVFTNMLGTPMDQVSLYRERISAMQRDAQRNYEDTRQLLESKGRDISGLEKIETRKRKLTKAEATELMAEVGGDKARARQLAAERGLEF